MPNFQSVPLSVPNPAAAQRIASEAEIERQRQLAMQFAQQAGQTQKIANPLQGANYLAQNVFAGLLDRKADKAEKTRRDAMAQALTGALGDMSGYGIPEESLRQIMALDPSIGSTLLEAKMNKAINPPERWEDADLNGMPGQRNTVTGEFNPFDAPPKRDTAKDVNGIERFVDTGEPVFPDAPPKEADPAKLSNVITMRKEFESQPGVKRYRTAQPILASMAASVNDNSAMSDLDFVYGMAKIFDPESVVRESEMGLVIEGQSLPAQIVGTFSKVARGEQVLQPESRRQLVEASMRRVGEYRKQAEGEAAEFTGIAERARVAPADIVRPLEALPEWNPEPPPPETRPVEPVPPPQPGTVEDGFIFKGGDPRDPKNWEPVA